jgi:hypothetical protein
MRICNIWGFRWGGYEERRLLVCDAVYLPLLVTTNFVPTSLILLILMMEAISSSETAILTRSTRRHIPDDDIL